MKRPEGGLYTAIITGSLVTGMAAQLLHADPLHLAAAFGLGMYATTLGLGLTLQHAIKQRRNRHSTKGDTDG